MKRNVSLSLAALVAAVGCTGDFGRVPPTKHMTVKLAPGPVGTPGMRLPISITNGTPYTVTINALGSDGAVDASFNGYARVTVKPGTVVSVTGPNTDGRNVKLVNGVADNVLVTFVAAYGDARIWAEDMGYIPADPAGMTPPQCSDGKDNNGNGLIDFPADPGCAFPNDDTEDPGSYAAGASDPIYFVSPRIADVRGISAGGNGTVFPHEQVAMDVGYRVDNGVPKYLWNSVVARVASDGFYVTDLQDDVADPTMRPGYGSVYAYTYSTPPNMRVCDRVKVFAGTASDFFGFTEIGFPTWVIEEWDPTLRPCLVPSPQPMRIADLQNSQGLFKYESALARIQSDTNVSMHVTAKLGSGFVPLVDGAYVPDADHTDCDFDKNGKIAFDGGPENLCSTACTGDNECSEYSAFAGQSAVDLVITDSSTNPPTIFKAQVSGAQAPTFDPVALRGKTVSAFTGTLRFFSGGSQWTLEARCDDDIVLDPTKQPFCSDADYDRMDPSCAAADGSPPPVPPTKRLLACVHARTIFTDQGQ